jgi:hypothetical protein
MNSLSGPRLPHCDQLKPSQSLAWTSVVFICPSIYAPFGVMLSIWIRWRAAVSVPGFVHLAISDVIELLDSVMEGIVEALAEIQ